MNKINQDKENEKKEEAEDEGKQEKTNKQTRKGVGVKYRNRNAWREANSK